MKIPFSWLKEYVEVDIPVSELQERLFSCGFEVEELIDLSQGIERVVVGIITEAVKSEGTHLTLCKVDCGAYGADIQISTGADNIFVGAHVPVALENALLPGNKKILKKELIGIESCGMLCSGTELGLNDDLFEGAEVYRILLLPENTVPGTDICSVVGLDDYVLDISITANRPDCQSILGIAREVAAMLNKPLKMPSLEYEVSEFVYDGLSLSVDAKDLCPRYLGRIVRNFKMGRSPQWMRRNLALCGLRSINNIVDITNYVMLEIGQPMHAFDLDTIQGQISVRRAKSGEKIVTLDGKEFQLDSNNLVICDDNGPIALAGIMGGFHSEITDRTSTLLFEAAKFERGSIRKTARSLGQNTDASSRYEKGISEYTVEIGMARALHLIQKLGGGEIALNSYDISAGAPRQGKHFKATITGINRILGIDIPGEIIINILLKLNFEVKNDGDVLEVTAPRYREDIEIGEPDLAEEVIREYGYEHIIPTFLKNASVTNGGLNNEQRQREKIKRIMCAQGCCEVSTLAFYSEADLDMMHIVKDAYEKKVIHLLNPITTNLSIMRPLLAPSLLNTVIENIKRGNNEGRIFELANIYRTSEKSESELPKEILHLGFAAFGDNEDFYTVKGIVEALGDEFGISFTYERAQDVPWLHPGVSAYILCNNERVGVIGKLSNSVLAELKLPKDGKENHKIFISELDYKMIAKFIKNDFQYKPIPKYPVISRDIAVTVDEEIMCGTIVDEIFHTCQMVKDVELFDVYRGEQIGKNRKGMTFKLIFEPSERALSLDDVNSYIDKILMNLKAKYNINMR